MKRKNKYIFAILPLLVLLIWYFSPTSFLKSTESSNVRSIHVFNATNGTRFEIQDEKDISYVITQIQNKSFEKEEISLFQKGGRWYILSFRDSTGKEIRNLTVNSDKMIRKDPFFYCTEEDMEILDLLREREEQFKMSDKTE